LVFTFAKPPVPVPMGVGGVCPAPGITCCAWRNSVYSFGDSHDGWWWFRYVGVVWWPVCVVGEARY
jgi:hypothetical protein